MHFNFYEEWIYCWADLPTPGDSPSLMVGPRSPEFERLFNPNPTAFRRRFYSPEEKAIISIDSNSEFHGGHWFFCPAPFCFALKGDSEYLAVGVASPTASLAFTAFEYDGAFTFRYGRPRRGPFQTPRLVIIPTGGDHYHAIERYCDHIRNAGLAPRGSGRKLHPWWLSPNFCGWGEQSYRGCAQEGFRPGKLPDGTPERCSQSLYEEIMELLDAERLDPGVVTIDDKWQQSYGLAHPNTERWPDMSGFIRQQHSRGRRVLLWWKLWDGEGLADNELIPGGSRAVADPTSPAYRVRLKSEARYALMELGADGFKIDFLHNGPKSDHELSQGGLEGVLLLREMLALLQEAALEAKDDCLLVTHAANPYLADLFDVVRLNDIPCPDCTSDSISEEMRHRAKIAAAACPEAPIDTDNWPCPNKQQWAEYLKIQPEIGIPSLYYATGIDMSSEPFGPDDYNLIRQTWAKWMKR